MKTATPLSMFLARPLAILPSALAALEETIRAGPPAERHAEAAPISQQSGAVAIIRMHGPVWAGAPEWLRNYMALTDPYEVTAAINAALGNSDIVGIVLDVNSPGGMVDGVDAAAEAIRAAAAQKPVIATVRDLAASAAYWMASGATQILTSRTSMVGSIGTYIRWTDSSAMFAEEGLAVHVYRSGDLKAPGQPGEARNEYVDETYSSVVEDTNAVFLRAVSLGRGVGMPQVRERWASGRCWIGESAVTVGVADALGSLSDAIQLAAGNRVLTRRAAGLNPESLAPAAQGSQEEPPVDEQTLKLLGLKADATPEQVQAAIQKREAAARAEVLAALGLEGEEEPDLKALAAQAADGVEYRKSLVERLRAATITQQGNDEAGQAAADRAAKVWGTAEIGDLRAEVERLEGQRESSLPAGRVSKDQTEQTSKKPRRSARAFGRV